MKRILLILCVFYCGLTTAHASVAIHIDPPTIPLNETVRVTLTFDNAQNHSPPDFSPLLHDFDIISTEHSSSYTAINGQARSFSQWSLVLRPKREGVLPIPPIHIGQEQSLASQVTVTPPTASPTSPTVPESDPGSKKIEYSLFTAEVNDKKPYINQQVIYKVKLFNRQRLLDAQYQPPQVDDALLIPLGGGRHYQTEFKGKSYDVEEQQYALFPQKKGLLTIQPPALSALVYDGFTPTRVNLQAKPITLNINAIPSPQTRETWLPSTHVKLTESYDHTESNLDEGSTLVRTITMQAAGVVGQLLPKLPFTNQTHFSVYPDKPIINNELREGDLWSSSTTQVTYLLTKPGETILPAIQVPWYNTSTKQMEMATLPAHAIVIKPKQGAIPSIRPAKKKSAVSAAISTKPQHTLPVFMTWFGLIILALLSCIILWRLRSQYRESKKTSSTTEVTQQTLRTACKHNDPTQARAALLTWARKQWPNQNIFNLNDIPVHSDAFKQQLEQLSAALYSPHHQAQWTGDGLWQSIVDLKSKQSKPKHRKTKLPPIYPGRT